MRISDWSSDVCSSDLLPDGIVHVALPTPFPVGPVNCYVLLDDPVTVVDPGMMWADSTQLLEATLAAHGRTLAEVAQVLITHGHLDPFGAAGWLAGPPYPCVVCERAEGTPSPQDRKLVEQGQGWNDEVSL